MADHKRKAGFQDECFIAKRTKDTDLGVGGGEKGRVEKENDVLERNQPASNETNGQNGSNSLQELLKDCKKDTEIPGINSASEDASLCNSKVVHQEACKLSCIEADAAEDKGSRHTMEDAWVVLPDASLEYPGNLRCAHFAIYDGHGGRLAAEYAQRYLHANVLVAGLPRESMDVKAAKRAILEGFRRTDESLLQESAKGNWLDGATAVCVWILGQTVLVANIGDAKSILARSSSADGSLSLSNESRSTLKAIVMTREHKAIYPQERARIQKAGGSVGPNGRLQGRLEVSRAFGDRQFKKVGVIATPDVHSFELTRREQFIILGCDGLWGVFGPSDAVDFVQKQLEETSSATTAARRLVREAVRERHCKDNCTAIVIVFRHN
ncbi:probable protein phosphatase 2C 67 [Phoenix dactylifera]|uniref:protein-serine/threonine phosphatase n=1 Tax=Phoenix dactylifera TaxID=42345 RepID=A0A8B7BXZ1_PHODC|nr:probable protein phosphatase 2C 67 [Phoenix dactylifera]XP_008787673.2 probable protein phosphatase 2C 67 [Phoenix dactylifera]XP_008787675.2 probable protein phosphatase 2C 67 [Phoenix dactylifera]XP_038981594.1 probable protein phosphatase 2C 67 [Phoenix dactylifera]